MAITADQVSLLLSRGRGSPSSSLLLMPPALPSCFFPPLTPSPILPTYKVPNQSPVLTTTPYPHFIVKPREAEGLAPNRTVNDTAGI